MEICPALVYHFTTLQMVSFLREGSAKTPMKLLCFTIAKKSMQVVDRNLLLKKGLMMILLKLFLLQLYRVTMLLFKFPPC